MRYVMAGFAVFGTLAMGSLVPAAAHPLSVPSPLGISAAVQKAAWDGDECGPRCREHRREVREHERWTQHRRWEESHRYPPPAYDYQRRY